jgi:hypothetical protein
MACARIKFRSQSHGGSDGARTRDLRRDRPSKSLDISNGTPTSIGKKGPTKGAELERQLSIYDGRDRIGAIIARPGACEVFDAGGCHIGSFKSIKAAKAAIHTSLSGLRVCDFNAGRDDG